MPPLRARFALYLENGQWDLFSPRGCRKKRKRDRTPDELRANNEK